MIRFVFLCLLIVLFSCREDAPEYKEAAKDVSYKYLKFGEGSPVSKGKFIKVYLTIMDDQKDTLHYVPNYPYFIEVGDHAIDSAWMNLSAGDSVHIMTKRAILNEYIKLYHPMQSDLGNVELRAAVKMVLDSTDVDKEKSKLHSERELEEQIQLSNYLNSLSDSIEELNGIYRTITHKTNGDTLKYGDQLSIAYKGKFLNGYVFDNTDDKGVTPTFRYGEEYQLVEGVESGLMGLKEGESVKIILPSRLAFGEEGSLAGIVPPYTAVIFEIKLLKIEK